MNDTVGFLLKVLLLSAGLSFLIKLAGPSLPLRGLEIPTLNHLALVIITLPSLLVGAFLLFKTRS
ncbi:MAG: hypothetical protein ACFB0D_23655 [Phormidesmis sp.]